MADNNTNNTQLDDETIRQLNEVIRDGNTLSGSQRDYAQKWLEALIKATKELTPLDSINADFARLDKEIKRGNQSYLSQSQSLIGLGEKISKLTDETEKSRSKKKLQDRIDKTKKEAREKALLDAAESTAKAFVTYYTSAYKSVISNYQSGASVFQANSDIAVAEINRNTEIVHGITGVITQFSDTMSIVSRALGKSSGMVWAGVGALSLGVDALYKYSAEWKEFTVKAMATEMDNSIKAMHDISTAGGFFAGGLSDMREKSIESNLLIQQFAKAISDNSDNLGMFGGSVTNGIKKFVEVNKAMEGYRQGLISMGLSIDDIADGVAMYMGTIGRSGARIKLDANALAMEANAYMINMKAINSYTGEDAKKAQARADKAAAQTAVYAKLYEMATDPKTGKVNDEKLANLYLNFTNTMKQVAPQYQLGAMQLFANHVITDPDTNIFLANVPSAAGIFDAAVKSMSSTDVNAPAQFQRDMKSIAARMKNEIAGPGGFGSSLGQVSLALKGEFSTIEDMAQTGLILSLRNEKQIGTTFDEALTGYDSWKNDKNKFADQVIEGQKNNIEIMKQMSAGLEHFSDLMSETNEKISGYLVSYDKFLATLGAGNNRNNSTPSSPSTPTSGNFQPGQINLSNSLGPRINAPLTSLSQNDINNVLGWNGVNPANGKATLASIVDMLFNAGQANLSKVGGTYHQELLNSNLGAVVDALKKEGGRAGAFGFNLKDLQSFDPNFVKRFDADGQRTIARSMLSPSYNQYASGKMSKEDFATNISTQFPNLLGKGVVQTPLNWNDTLKKLADGGIITAKQGGTAVLAAEAGKNEAYIPMNGDYIPVNLNLASLVDKLNTVVNLVAENKNTTTQIHESLQ